MPEKIPQHKNPNTLDEAYKLLEIKTPLELFRLYSAEDQKLMKSNNWDYNNPELITNKIKDILESVDEAALTDDEKEWRQEILWYWYHHAISCAIWRHQDKEAARWYASKALEYQLEDHPNKITRLLYLLVNDRLEEAEEWLKTIQDEPEKGTGSKLLKEFKEHNFFEEQP